MPLSGLVDGEPVVSCLLTEEEWSQLRDDVRAKRRTVTMRCGWKGQAKTSKLGTQYFAHAPGGDGCSAGETAQHLRAKAIIVEAITRAGWTAQTEVPGEGWVADVMATLGDVHVVFEVQWSRQDLAEYRHRQQRYRDAGIDAIAWFARHDDDLPGADKDLPVFGLDVNDAGEATAMVGVNTLPLAEVVDRLLTRRLQHRKHLANGQPADAFVVAAVIACYRCHKEFGVWTARQTTVDGNCGGRDFRYRSTGVFAEHRPETIPSIREAGEQLSRDRGVQPGRIFRRHTETAGTHYMAFTCPHCNATCGDMFVEALFTGRPRVRSRSVSIPPTALARPHWCLAGNDGLCLVPPESVLAELARLSGPKIDPLPGGKRLKRGGASEAAVTRSPVGTHGGIPAHEVVARMFGRH
jgi:hypothetical protein